MKGELVFFTNGRNAIVHNVILWRSVAFHPALSISLVKDSTFSSAQLAELVAVHLALKDAIRQSLSQIHIFTDSCAVGNGLVVWSGQCLRVNVLK